MKLALQYVELLDAMPDGMVVTDERGRIVYANRLFEKLSGYEGVELAGEPVEVLVPERLRAPHQEHRHGYYETGEPTRPMGAGLDISLRRADGTEIPVDISLSPAQIDGHRFVVAAVRDITERRQAEALIRENERRWNELLDNVQLAVVGLDPEGRVTYVNPFFLKLTGCAHQEALGVDWVERFVPEHERSWGTGAGTGTGEAMVEVGGQRYHENDVLTRSGRRRTLAWFNTRLRDVDGRPMGTMSVGADVTERRQAEARARALNEVAQAILGRRGLDDLLTQVSRSAAKLVGADLGMVVMPSSEGRLSLRAASGVGAEELRGTTYSEAETVAGEVLASGRALAVDDARADDRYAASPLRTVESLGPAAFVPLWAQGEVFGVLAVASRQGGRTFDEQALGELETFGAQASVALEYGRTQAQLRRMALLEDRERIARELHDTVIQQLFATGMSLQALAAGSAGETLDPSVLGERIRSTVNDLDAVIDEIRSTIFALESSERGLGTFRARVVELLAEAARGLGFEPTVRFRGAVESVPDDIADQMLAALREALSNVVRHAEANRVDVTVSRDGDLSLLVADDGVGVSPEVESATAGATGLGIRNLRRRAEQLDGTFVIRRREPRGTVVEWQVPIGD